MGVKRFTVERTLGTVLCECPESLCVHPNGYREVSEWVVVDHLRDSQSELFDYHRDAKREADRLNEGNEDGTNQPT